MKGKILCIEPAERLYSAMDEIFSNEGYKTLWASSGMNGVSTFRQQHDDISLVILEEDFPNFAEAIPTINDLLKIDPKIPIVVIGSRKQLKSDSQTSTYNGCREYISNPLTHVHIMHLIRKYVIKSSSPNFLV